MNDIREELAQMRDERFNRKLDVTIRWAFYVSLGLLGWVGVLCLR